MAVITISGEMGSTGDWMGDKGSLAVKLIEATGYHDVDKRFLSKLFCEYGPTRFDRGYTQTLGFWEKFDMQREEERSMIVDLLKRATLALANPGNMILVGRGNFAMLQGFTDVLNVHIQASLSTRTAAAMKRFQLTDASEAEAILKKSDDPRESFIQDFSKGRCDWAEGFDWVINTTKTGPEVAVETILSSLHHLEQHQGAGLNRGTLKPDQHLVHAVQTLLNCTKTHS